MNDNRALGCGGKLNIKYIINGLITGYKTGYVQVTNLSLSDKFKKELKIGLRFQTSDCIFYNGTEYSYHFPPIPIYFQYDGVNI